MANQTRDKIRPAARDSHLASSDFKDQTTHVLALIHDAVAHLVGPMDRLSEAGPALERMAKTFAADGQSSFPGGGLASLAKGATIKSEESFGVALVGRDYRLAAG